jgi:hypothetical protein
MIKFLFFDCRWFEEIEGFTRRLESPRKHDEPLLISDRPWEGNAIRFYGSVLRRPDGCFQMWYKCGGWRAPAMLAYAESDDGIEWRRPELDVFEWEGRRTNVVLDHRPIGTSVIHDEREPRPGWRYKLLYAPGEHERLSALRSADGIHWLPAAENPVIGTHPDGPTALLRQADGRYAVYHRPCWGDRRVARSDSWDFIHWPEARVVLEPDQSDPANVQFYGLGAIPYGAYEIGTLWHYDTDPDDTVWSKGKGVLWPELVHSRGGYAWHRTAQGTPWIALEREKGSFGHGQIMMASQPVFLDDEIRFYYAASKARHGEMWDWPPDDVCWAVSSASCKPDRFISARCGGSGRLLTRPFWVETPGFFVNADIGGSLRAAVTDIDAKPIVGFTMAESKPIRGDSCAHVLEWADEPDRSSLADRELRLRIEVEGATLYSISAGSAEDTRRYWEFRLPNCPKRYDEMEWRW